jgi:hypothetical protein
LCLPFLTTVRYLYKWWSSSYRPTYSELVTLSFLPSSKITRRSN